MVHTVNMIILFESNFKMNSVLNVWKLSDESGNRSRESEIDNLNVVYNFKLLIFAKTLVIKKKKKNCLFMIS